MTPTNMLFVMSDEHNRRIMGAAGHEMIRTPNMDALAASGVRFTDAYCNSPICVPSRASFATGRYPHQTGFWDNAIAYDGSVPSWHHRLVAAGHEAVSIGKLHFRSVEDANGFSEEIMPLHIVDGVGDALGLIRGPDMPPRKAALRMAEEAGPGDSSYQRYDDRITEAAVTWLQDRAAKSDGKPWTLFVSLVCPHFPLISRPEWYNLYPEAEVPWPQLYAEHERPEHPFLDAMRRTAIYDEGFNPASVRRALAAYFGMVSFLDDNIGKLIQALEQTGLSNNTRVIYTSDHGDNLGNRGLWGKSNMYEDSAGIPMLMAGPDVPAGVICREPVSLIDSFPTILDCVGCTPEPADHDLPGNSLFDVVSGAVGHRTVFSEYHASSAITGAFMLRRGRHKLVHYEGMPPQLFDVVADPWEARESRPGSRLAWPGRRHDRRTAPCLRPGRSRRPRQTRPAGQDRQPRWPRGGDGARHLRPLPGPGRAPGLLMTHLLNPTRSRWMRILGVAFVMYVLSYIDRTNIAMATPSMRGELGLTAAAIGFATSMFFWGYLILQVPAGRLAGVWSAKNVITIQLVFWCGASLSTAFVRTETELLINRFVLGIAEGGVLTCCIVLIRAWFTKAERARANTMFLLSVAVAPVIANPLSGYILGHFDWQTMFIVEALPAAVWGFVWWWAISDRPHDAAWLDPVEKATLIAALEREAQIAGPPRGHWLSTLWHPAVLALALYNFMALMAEWGVNFWLPTVLKETGLSIGTVGLLAALPYALGIVMMILVARSSDRHLERKWHMIAATAFSGLFLVCAQLSSVMGVFATVLFLSLAVGSFLGRFGPFWTLPSEVLPPAVAGVGIGLINGTGNLGGTVGPYFFGAVRDATGSFNLALTVGGVSLIIASLVAVPIGTRARLATRPS